MSLHIPQAASDITTAWLTGALREGGWLPAGEVTSATASDIGIGRGYVSQTLRVALEYDGETGAPPRSLIAKVPTFMQYDPSLAGVYALIQTIELSFYRDLAAECPVRIPKPYWVGMSPGEGRFCLLMEDMGDLRTMAQAEVMDDASAALAVDAAARLHAHFWHDPRLVAFDWLLGPDMAGMQIQAVYEPSWPVVIDLYGSRLDPAFRQAGDWLATHVAEAQAGWSAANWTLVHGDYRVENFLFGAPGTAEDLVVLDWQLTSRGGGPYDIAYLLGQGLGSADRRRLERDLVRRYHEGLRAGGVSGYSFEDCWDDYRRGLLVASFVPVNGVRTFATVIPPEDPAARAQHDQVMEAGRALIDLMMSRSVAAIVETEAYRFAR